MTHANHDKHAVRENMSRSDFGLFIDKAFWVLALAIGGFIGGEIKDMGKSVNELNQKVAVVIERQNDLTIHSTKIDEIISNFNERLSRLETSKRR